MSSPKPDNRFDVPLWLPAPPLSHGEGPEHSTWITVFLPEGAAEATPCVVVCPGGGYGFLADQHEGVNIATWFQERGVAGCVLHYRLPSNGYRHPSPLLEAQRAMRLVRSHAADWKIDPAKVGVMGFSAGGHLASTLDTHFDSGTDTAKDPVERLSCRPDFAVLVYPVITLKTPGVTHEGSKENLLGPDPDPATVLNLSNEAQVTPQTPPTLLIHSVDDDAVPIENSRLMLAALQKAGVPSALHEYPTGGHGFGHGPNQHNSNEPAGWLDKAYDWLKSQGSI